jgi:hypothetical protein
MFVAIVAIVAIVNMFLTKFGVNLMCKFMLHSVYELSYITLNSKRGIADLLSF